MVACPAHYGRRMRVGIYVDGYNLYHGGRGLMGGPGLAGQHSGWAGAQVSRVVYCTARISGASNPTGAQDQDV